MLKKAKHLIIERECSSYEVGIVQEQLAQTANDPDLKISSQHEFRTDPPNPFDKAVKQIKNKSVEEKRPERKAPWE